MTARTSFLPIFRDREALRLAVSRWRAAGERVALVPTMGALHAGHMALVARGRQLADRVVASVFVNPIQFGPKEDFAAYPRREAEDAALLAEAGAAGLYAPDAMAMYPEGFATSIVVGGPSEGLCGAFRPGHFSGVATVVAKLLLQAKPDVALFGEKDYQQLQVIKRLVADLDIDVAIDGVPIVREADGLALSSRNAYLTPGQRTVAPLLHRTLASIAEKIETGANPIAECAAGSRTLLEGGFSGVDYLELRDAVDLVPVTELARPARLLVAAHLGGTRLIDNLAVLPRRSRL